MRRFLFALLAASAIALFAAPAGAAPGDTVTVTGGQYTATIVGTNGGAPFADLGGVVVTTDGLAYCSDINTLIKIGDTVTEVPWDQLAGNGVPSSALPAISAIVNYEFPQSQGFALVGTDQDKALAVQAAIWHFANGFVLSQNSADNSQATIDNYNSILSRVTSKAYPSLKPQVLSITPASATGTANTVVGPFTLASSEGSAVVTVASGGTLVDAQGTPLASNTIPDGGEFYVKSSTTGTVTVEANADFPRSSARAFNTEGIQRLVIAQRVTDPKTAASVATFEPPSTSVGPNTTTRPPSTTAGPNITAEVNVAGEQATRSTVSSLPRTGGTPTLLPYGLALVGAGLLLVAVQHRQRVAVARSSR
ncbi:MAG: thioester domain-containing protein [Acidimicrobiia bacterium]